MSLSLALGSATSSLRSIQSELAIASNNIANADTDGYTVKSAVKVSTTVGGNGIGTGVTIQGVTSGVDANLLKTIVVATSESAEASTTSAFLDMLGEILGQLSSGGSGDTLSSKLSELKASFEELAATPESETLKTQTVLQLADLTASLRDMSAQVQDLRAQADSGIETAVATVNSTLHAIDELNVSIVQSQARGESTADLEDQRMVLVTGLAAQMNVSYFTDSTGAMTIYTGGYPLLNSSVHELSYQAAGTVTSQTVYPGGFDAITLDGRDVTGTIKSGAIAALVETRDETLVDTQDSLDAIAQDLMDQLNGLANQGSALPPPQSLTGSATGFAGTDALSATGTLTVALAGSDGQTSTTTDIDMTTVTTIDDLLAQLNAISGISASLDTDGGLVVASTDSALGVVVSGGDVGGKTVSAAFGLNDILTGTGAENLYLQANLAADPSLLPLASLDGDSLGLGAGALAQDMADAISTTSAATLISDIGAKAEAASSRAASKETTLTTLTDSFSSRYGVNVDEETARISQLENAYSASAQVLSAVQEMFDALLSAVR